MYKIIGADQKEYGPVSAEQLKQWIQEGRVSGQTLARPEGETGWRPVGSFAEFADALQQLAPIGMATGASAAGPVSTEVVLGRDFDLDIGNCISRAWDLVKQNFWPVTGVSFLLVACKFVINQSIGLLFGPLIHGSVQRILVEHRVTPLEVLFFVCCSLVVAPISMLLKAGLFKYCLKLIRGERPSLSDAFAGFSPAAGQLILLGLVSGILTSLAYALCFLPGIYVSVCWIFALPLVIDRNLAFWPAMELSWRVVTKHWFIVFAFWLVIGLLELCGLIVCCVGVIVTTAIASVALLYAYEDIFGRSTA